MHTLKLHTQLPLLLALIAWAGSGIAQAGRPDGLAPCAPAEPFTANVIAQIDQVGREKILLGFTAFTFFEGEWGIRILQEGKNPAILRFVHLGAPLRRSDIALSPELSDALQRVVNHELRTATPANQSFGLDGDIYRFTSAGAACADTWSPASDTRAGKLVDVFNSLRTLSSTPSRFLRGMREKTIMHKLRSLLPPR